MELIRLLWLNRLSHSSQFIDHGSWLAVVSCCSVSRFEFRLNVVISCILYWLTAYSSPLTAVLVFASGHCQYFGAANIFYQFNLAFDHMTKGNTNAK